MRYALLLLALAAVMTAQADDKLAGYWPFEETAGMAVLDASNLGHGGEIMNEGRGVKRVPGRVGCGLEFAAGEPNQRGRDGAVALQGMGEMDWSQGLTVEAWVLFHKLDRPATYELVSNTRDDRGPGWRLIVSWQSLWLRSGEGAGGKTWGAATNATAVQFRTGQWYHLAGTYDGKVFRVYVDGALAGESEGDLPLTKGDAVTYLGSYRGGYAYGLNGVMDEVRLYNKARTAEEIMAEARLGR